MSVTENNERKSVLARGETDKESIVRAFQSRHRTWWHFTLYQCQTMKCCHTRHKMPPKCWLFAVRYLHETLSLLLMHNDVLEVWIFCATKVALFFTLINCYGNLYWTHNLVRSRLYSEFWFKIGWKYHVFANSFI